MEKIKKRTKSYGKLRYLILIIPYIKHGRLCLTTFRNTEKRVENRSRSGVFLTNFEVFGNVVKHCLDCLDIPSQSKLKLRRKRRNKIEKNLC